MSNDILKKLFEVYKPKAPDEQKFVDKHVTIKHKDRNGNGDDVFNASNIKTIKRKEEGHGYDTGEDEKVYEETEDLEEASYQKVLTAKQKWASHPTPSNERAYKKAKEDHMKAKASKVSEEVEQLKEGTMKLSKVHIVHHHDHPAAKEFAKNYTEGMKGMHREGGPTEKDDKASDNFHTRYTSHTTRNGFAGSGTTIYHDHKTGAKWKVDRHPNGKTFYGTDHIISHHTGDIHEAFDLEEGEVLDTEAEDRVIRSLVAYYEELGEETLIEDIVAIAEEMIDELSRKTLGSYAVNASRSAGSNLAGAVAGGMSSGSNQDDVKKMSRTYAKRMKGVETAVNKLAKEEVEDLDELSVDTLDKYRSKARRDLIDADANDDTRLYNKRAKGYRAASKQVQKKLTKEDVINRAVEKYVPEDVQLPSMEERLAEKLEGLGEGTIDLLFSLFENLSEDNQRRMLDTVETQDGINGLIDFALTNRGE